MAPSHCTLSVVPLLIVTIMLVTFTHRVFALTRSRVSRQNTDDHKSQSPQHHDDGHKSRSQQDFEDQKSLSHQQHHLKSTAHYVLTCLGSIIDGRHNNDPTRFVPHQIAPLATGSASPTTRSQEHDTACHFPPASHHLGHAIRPQRFWFRWSVSALARLRPAQNIHLGLLPRSQPSMTPHAFPRLQVTDMITALLHCLLVSIRSWLAQAGRRPHTQQDHRTPHHGEQSSIYSTVSSTAMRTRMHWIQDPASYSMMQHQSFVAPNRESAKANAYVLTLPSPNLITNNN
jgi:hypothetical protein